MRSLFIISLLLLSFCSVECSSRSLFVSGPMIGYTELRTARIWVEVAPATSKISVTYWKGKNRATAKVETYKGVLDKHFPTASFTLTALDPGTTYQFEVAVTDKHGRTEKRLGMLSTTTLWQHRTRALDFSFITGSCAYFNEPLYDRPGAPYGGDSSIFVTMAKQKADLMLWLGDNWYTREVDYSSSWGLRYRAHTDRSLDVLQPLLRKMPQYAIWDDHDFGPNDFGASYPYKRESREVFMDYWANPSYGQDDKGIYTQFNASDVAFFLLDDRTWRSNDGLADSISGLPDPDKQMFGRQQMQWLKDALLSQRNATFKIIANGSQILNPSSPYDCLRHFGTEFTELMNFIADYNINGVVFLTGDRHRSEIIKMERPGNYTLYDVTVSPLTSHVYVPGGPEKDMQERVNGTLIMETNFARISVTGEKGERMLIVSFLNIQGIEKGKWEIGESDLKKK